MNDWSKTKKETTLTIRLMNSGSADLPESITNCSFPVKNQVLAMYVETTIAPNGSK